MAIPRWRVPLSCLVAVAFEYSRADLTIIISRPFSREIVVGAQTIDGSRV
jgi:hypothetical protein